MADVLANPGGFTSAALKGGIIEYISGDKYRFRDGMGKIQLEIDSNVTLNPPLNKTVLVSGDVDIDDGAVQVDVRSLELSQ